MNEIIAILGFLAAAGLTACTLDSGTGSSSQTVVLDVRCSADADCPSGFECETEVEHGTASSYCVSHDSHTSNGECPAGFELEVEHGSTFCKPHGGDDGGSDDSGRGGDDD
jgi:Cys-rich repeat protein